jgi:hypothetical protein
LPLAKSFVSPKEEEEEEDILVFGCVLLYEVLTQQKFLLFKPQADFIAVDGGKPFLSDVPSFRTGHLRPF